MLINCLKDSIGGSRALLVNKFRDYDFVFTYGKLQLGQPIPEEKWKESMNLQILVSNTNVTHSKDPTVRPVFEDFNVIPSLGVGVTQS